MIWLFVGSRAHFFGTLKLATFILMLILAMLILVLCMQILIYWNKHAQALLLLKLVLQKNQAYSLQIYTHTS